MRIIIEVDSDGRVSAKHKGKKHLRKATLQPFDYVTEVQAPIIYTPTVTNVAGAQLVLSPYTVHRLACTQRSTSVPYIVPYVTVGPAALTVPVPASTQYQYLTTGVLSAGEPNTNLWYQTMTIILPTPFTPIQHRVFDPFIPPPPPIPPTLNGIAGVTVRSPVTSNGCVALYGYPTAASPVILYAWKSYNGDDFFLQQPT